MEVIIRNMQEEVPFSGDLEGLVERVALAVMSSEGCREGAEISVLITDDSYIKDLNSGYRGIDTSTDVLSFALSEGDPMPDAGEEELLGDVVISLPTAVRQGEEYGHGLGRELAYLTAHGVLHLLGYNHIDEAGRAAMREREEAALGALGMGKG